MIIFFRSIKTRKSSCLNARGIPLAVEQVLALLFSLGGGMSQSWLGGGYPILTWPGGLPPSYPDWGRGYPILTWLGGVPQDISLSQDWGTPLPQEWTWERTWDCGTLLRMWTDKHLWKQYLPHPSGAGSN